MVYTITNVTNKKNNMKTLEQQLANYALYHRDKRNINTHFIGIPLIVLAVIYLLYIPIGVWFGIDFKLAHIAIMAVTAYYLALSPLLGILMLMVLSAMDALVDFSGQFLNQYLPGGMLTAGIAIFVIGWIFQFIGHYYEGKKPAFVDDLIGLVIGPLFVLVEVLFKFGFFQQLEKNIIEIAGDYR